MIIVPTIYLESKHAFTLENDVYLGIMQSHIYIIKGIIDSVVTSRRYKGKEFKYLTATGLYAHIGNEVHAACGQRMMERVAKANGRNTARKT